MRFNFDNLRLGQRIVLLAGIVISTLIFMFSPSSLHIAIGTLILCGLFAFVLRYQKIRLFFLLCLLIAVIIWAGVYGNMLFKEWHASRQVTPSNPTYYQEPPLPSAYYAIRKISSKEERAIGWVSNVSVIQISKFQEEKACLDDLGTRILPGQISSQCASNVSSDVLKTFSREAVGQWYIISEGTAYVPTVLIFNFGKKINKLNAWDQADWTFEDIAYYLRAVANQVESLLAGYRTVRIFSPAHEIAR